MRRLVVVLLAGMAVLGIAGGAWGASKINGRQIKTGTITGKQIKNHSVTPKDFRGSVRGPRGYTGDRGLQGLQGPQGPQGSPGLAGVQEVESTPVSVPPGGFASPDANCPGGKRVIGTGFNDSLADEGFVKGYTYFVGAFFSNDSSITVNVSVQAICAAVSGATAASASHISERRRFDRDVRGARLALPR